MSPDHSSPVPGNDLEGTFLRSAIAADAGGVRTRVSFDGSHQGWNGMPHGGVLMSMLLELVHRGLHPPLFGSGAPWRVGFRLGGPPLSIRDSVEVGARREEGAIQGWVRKEQDTPASLEARIDRLAGGGGFGRLDMERVRAVLDRVAEDGAQAPTPLPYSRSCFVCGAEREAPGLERRFFCIDGGHGKIAFTYVGLDPDDRERFGRFRLPDGQAHPGTLVAILDETLGWSGFVETLQGGVTVKLEVDIHRPWEPGEKMLCFGLCTGTRGRDPQRRFWFAEGAALPMGDGDPAPIMTARGQWLSVPRLTDEMRRHLYPRAWLERWLQPAGG